MRTLTVDALYRQDFCPDDSGWVGVVDCLVNEERIWRVSTSVSRPTKESALQDAGIKRDELMKEALLGSLQDLLSQVKRAQDAGGWDELDAINDNPEINDSVHAFFCDIRAILAEYVLPPLVAFHLGGAEWAADLDLKHECIEDAIEALG